MNRSTIVGLGLALIFTWMPQARAAPLYRIADLGTLGGSYSDATAINDAGQVVGESQTAAGQFHAFLYSGGPLQDLGTLGGNASIANSINNAGRVVGESETAGGQYHAFLYDSDPMQDLGTLGGNASAAFGINSSGQVAGEAETGTGGPYAFLDGGEPMQNLGTLGGDFSVAYAVNDAGQAVGEAETGTWHSHAFLYDGAPLQDLGTLGGNWSVANGINTAGHVVGESDTTAGGPRAFLYAAGPLQDLGTLGGNSSAAFAINDSGLIVGESDTGGGAHAFLYDPATEIMTDLNHVVPYNSGWTVRTARDVNALGQIAASGFDGAENHALLLTPVDELVWDAAGDGDWNSDSRWTGGDPGDVPDGTVRAAVPADTVTVTADGEAYGLLVESSGAVAVGTANTLTVGNGGAMVAGTLDLGATGVLDVDGRVTMQAGCRLTSRIGPSAGPGGPEHGRIVMAGGDAHLDGALSLQPADVGDETVPGNLGFTTRTIIDTAAVDSSIIGEFAAAPGVWIGRDSGEFEDSHLGLGVFNRGNWGNRDQPEPAEGLQPVRYVGDPATQHYSAVEVDLLVAKAGDVNGDGDVNGVDATILLSNWTPPGGGPERTWVTGDVSDSSLTNRAGDGDANGVDATVMLSNWDVQTGAAAAAPEASDASEAIARYNPATGEFRIAVTDVTGWIIIGENMFAGADALVEHLTIHPAAMPTAETYAVGETTMLTEFSYDGFESLGNIAHHPELNVNQDNVYDYFTLTYTMLPLGSPPQTGRITVVPEPGTVVMLIGGALAVLLLRRRCKRGRYVLSEAPFGPFPQNVSDPFSLP